MENVLLGFLTLLIMAAVGYAHLREGLFTAFAMFVNVIVAGVVAFSFWEPLAGALDAVLAEYADAVSMVCLFGLTLALLRWATNSLARTEIQYNPQLTRGGGVVFGLATGYLVSGFLVCLLQTLPWHENFLGFDAKYETGRSVRRVLPADQVWLALLFRGPAYNYVRAGDDRDEKLDTYEIRYSFYRRHLETVDPKPNKNEKPEDIRNGLRERRKEHEENLRKQKGNP